MASIRKAKKQAKKEGRVFIDLTRQRKVLSERESLLRSLKVQVEATNRQLKALNKQGFYNTFSSKKLFDRLGGKVGALQKSGNKITGIRIRKTMTMTDLNAISRATRNFLASDTSTPAKVKRVIRKTKKSMFQTLKLKDDKLTTEDIENYYDMLGDKDFDYFNEKLGASEMWAVIEDSIEAKDNQNDFIDRLSTLITLNDKDIRAKAINLFNKYV